MAFPDDLGMYNHMCLPLKNEHLTGIYVVCVVDAVVAPPRWGTHAPAAVSVIAHSCLLSPRIPLNQIGAALPCWVCTPTLRQPSVNNRVIRNTRSRPLVPGLDNPVV